MVPDPKALTTAICDALDWQAPVYGISALTGHGTQQLMYDIQQWLDTQRDIEDGIADTPDRDDPRFDPKRQKDRKSTRLNSSHVANSYAVFCLKKKTTNY